MKTRFSRGDRGHDFQRKYLQPALPSSLSERMSDFFYEDKNEGAGVYRRTSGKGPQKQQKIKKEIVIAGPAHEAARIRPSLSREFLGTIFGTIYCTSNRTSNCAKTSSKTMYDFGGFCTISWYD
jgi:hypothetical protein